LAETLQEKEVRKDEKERTFEQDLRPIRGLFEKHPVN
jgi:hypothetical protein